MKFIESVKSQGTVLPLAIIRIMLGFMLLWAFFDKMFGLGYATKAGAGMIDGGSPTYGFFEYASDTFQFLTNYSNILDVVIMIAFLLIGVTLILGIGMKISTAAGALLFFLMYISLFPPVTPDSNNPILDEHLIYIFALMAIQMTNAGDYLGLGKWWKEQSIVKRFPILE